MSYAITSTGSGGSKRYFIDGEPVDRLSHLLDAIIAKGPGLDRWRGANTIERLRLMPLADAATLPPYTALRRLPRLPGLSPSEIGTMAHKAAETEDFDPSHYHPDAAKAIEAVARFFEERKPVIHEREQAVGSKQYRYAGTPDAWGTLDGETVLLDYKFAKNIYERYHFQLAAYSAAAIEMGRDPVDAAYIVWLKGDGSYELVPATATPGDWLAGIAWYRALEAQRERMAA